MPDDPTPGPPEPGQPGTLVARAWQARQDGASAAAEALCRDALALAPQHRGALWRLSRLRLEAGDAAGAETLVARIVAGNRDDAEANRDLAIRLMCRGDPHAAETHARNAVRTAPADPQSHTVMAMVFTEAMKPHAAEAHYRRALALMGRRDPVVLSNHALALRMQGRLDEARALYAESVAGAPTEAKTLIDWARLEEADGRTADAAALAGRAAAALAPQDWTSQHRELRLLRADIQARQGDIAAALDTLSPPIAGEEWLARGRLLDRAGRYAEAFAAFDTGRAAMRAAGNPQYEAARADALATRLRGFFTAPRLATLPRAGRRTDRPNPVFILGFPRSGTTLVEQTLTATPAMAPGGELPLVWEVVRAAPRLLDSPLPFPEALSELWLADRAHGLDALRDHYLSRAMQFGVPADAALFTDKMPLNEMQIGLIGLMFPQAPLIHVRRHPLDVVLSVYSNNLTHGFHCSAALESAARHYVLVDGIVEHVRAQMGLRYYPLRYEDLVHDQERQVRALLGFVGVAFDPAHLRFHENRRHAPTASYAQVREALYGRSIGRWRHYRAQLAPVIPLLRPVIERLGYGCD